jgi:FkbM family methyltransferase
VIYSVLKTIALRVLPSAWLWPLKSWHYTRTLRRFDEREEPDLAVIRGIVEPGSVAVDLGANIGVYTKVLAQLVGPNGRVLSVEPVPDTYRILATNVRRLALRNVTPVNAAVSDRTGSVTMEIPRYASGGGNFYQAHIVDSRNTSDDGVARISVPATTVDDLLSDDDAARVGVVKCDVEGHELACLAGAKRLLARARPVWLIEASGDPDLPTSSASRVCAILASHGYAPWIYVAGELRLRMPGQRSVNLFFFTDEHVRRLHERATHLLP